MTPASAPIARSSPRPQPIAGARATHGSPRDDDLLKPLTLDDDEGDPTDTGYVVDGLWDEATTDAVIRWQEDLGVPATGQIATTDVVVIDGTAVVIDVTAEVGDRVSATSPVVELNVQSTIETRHLEHSGQIDVLVSTGYTIETGDVIYTVDGTPITAIVAPDGIDRELRDGVDDGEDVLALEQMLASLGYDADGDLDIALTAVGGPARLLRNDLAPDNNWVRLNLEDSAPVFGARVRLSAGGRQQLRYVQPSRSYLSQTEVTLTFGLGAAERIDALEITWPDGVVESPPPPPLNAAATIRRRR